VKEVRSFLVFDEWSHVANDTTTLGMWGPDGDGETGDAGINSDKFLLMTCSGQRPGAAADPAANKKKGSSTP
jgi:hypothetical protein